MNLQIIIKHPLDFLRKAFYVLVFHSYYHRWLVEHNLKKALNIHWHYHFKEPIRWDNPQTLNEKMQYLQLHNTGDLWTRCSDKYEVRSFLENRGLEKYLTRLYGVYDTVDDIDFSVLPNSFVLKCSHDSGSTYVVMDKGTTDFKILRQKLEKHMRCSYGLLTCELHYLKIKHRVIAEELLDQGGGMSIIDYKFCCINGDPQFCMVCYDRPASGIKGHADRVICDLNPWRPNEKYIKPEYKSIFNNRDVPKPENLEEMIELARNLSRNIPVVYVDMYNIRGRIVFGEMTFTRDGGRILYLSDEYQQILGNMIHINQ